MQGAGRVLQNQLCFFKNRSREEIILKFRPCIDIHNGKVKQIVGGSLSDEGSQAKENFVSEQNAAFYARLYKEKGLKGGHIILLNPIGTDFYMADKEQAICALKEFPYGMQVGGGITAENATEFIKLGASHVIVTSYVFKDGKIYFKNIEKLVDEIGKEHLVLDLSCRKKDGDYYIVTDRWQKFTDTKVTKEVLKELAGYCDEFIVHAVDVEGKAHGIEEPLAELLGSYEGIPITYAGGVGNLNDLVILQKFGQNRLDVTVGSSLDLFGGSLEFKKILEFCQISTMINK